MKNKYVPLIDIIEHFVCYNILERGLNAASIDLRWYLYHENWRHPKSQNH